MTRYHWVTPEIVTNPLRMPLALFYQLTRMASKFKAEEEESVLRRMAWQGWQIARHEYGTEKKRGIGFDKWQESVGLRR